MIAMTFCFYLISKDSVVKLWFRVSPRAAFRGQLKGKRLKQLVAASLTSLAMQSQYFWVCSFQPKPCRLLHSMATSRQLDSFMGCIVISSDKIEAATLYDLSLEIMLHHFSPDIWLLLSHKFVRFQEDNRERDRKASQWGHLVSRTIENSIYLETMFTALFTSHLS